MDPLTVTRSIRAPLDRVFRTVAHIDQFCKAVPDIVATEIVSEVKSGVGTRFRETRRIQGTEQTTELEVKEYVQNERVRIVADSHGTLWDSLFVVRSVGDHTELTLTMGATPQTLAAKLMTRMASSILEKALGKDMDAVKTYCESESES